jgi:hypothetical protein
MHLTHSLKFQIQSSNVIAMGTIYAVSLVLIALTYFELITKRHYPTANQRYSWNTIWLVFSLLVFTLSATRVGGSDWENYETVFNLAASSDSLLMALAANAMLEPGYASLNYLVSELGGSRRDLIYIESAISSLAIFLVLTRVPGGSIIVTWMLTLTFIGLMPVRQTVAISLMMIAFIPISRKLRIFFALIAPTIHISSIPLLAAKLFGKNHLSRFSIISISLACAVVTYFMVELLSGKMDLYLEKSSGLTELKSETVILGKLITLSIIVFLWYFASKNKKIAHCSGVFDYKVLHIITLGSIALAIINPAFIRLTSIFEIVYIWCAAESIYYVKSKNKRIVIYSILAIVVIAKLMKTLTQFEDVYKVCFLCEKII